MYLCNLLISLPHLRCATFWGVFFVCVPFVVEVNVESESMVDNDQLVWGCVIWCYAFSPLIIKCEMHFFFSVKMLGGFFTVCVIWFSLSRFQTSSIHGHPRSTSMRTATLLHPGTWRVSPAAALPTSSSLLPPQPTPAAWLIVTIPWTTISIMATHGPPPTSSAPLRAALLMVTTAVPRGAPSTLSAWWCQCLCQPLITPSLVALFPACTTAVLCGTVVETLLVAGIPETTTDHPHTVAAVKWTEFQQTSWTNLKSRCRYNEMASTHCSINAPPPQPRLQSSAMKVPGEYATWFTQFRSSSQNHTL